MKKIIGILLLTLLVFADQNTSETNKYQHEVQIIDIKSMPKIELAVKQPINWYLILLPITTIVIVIIGFLITRRQLINTSKETMHAFNMTLEHEKEKINKEIVNNNKQIWINELRNEISTYHTTLIDILERSADKDTDSVLVTISEQKTKIEFLLDDNEEKHKLLSELNLQVLGELSDILMIEKKDRDVKKFYQETEKIIKLTKEIIKEEWEKIKF